MPYGTAQINAFPSWIQEINAADPKFTVHVGDIKNGSTTCDNAYFGLIKSDFDTFENPFILTPGDNEWTDCHRTNNGSYNPLERLAYERATFFSDPSHSMGEKTMKLDSQASIGFPENARWREAGVQFATVNIVGSNNDLMPWTGIGNKTATPEQVAEEQARTDAAIAEIKAAFADAEKRHDRSVVILMQADMFDPTYNVTWNDNSAFKPIVQTLIDETNAFDGDVYLFNGDSHVYNANSPLASGSSWLSFYGVTGSADKLQRITVDGSSNNKDWLKVTVNRPGADQTLSWERVPYQHQA